MGGHDKGLSLGQRHVLADDSSHVLVAAGAGSGKTRLLVAYFLKALLEDGVPLEGLTAVTFTRKAAGELLSRIREALFEADRPDFARSLDSANIGTIHGLCSRLLRSDALAAGVDPAFTLLEAEAAALLREEVRAQVWSEVVEQATETELEVLALHRKTLEAELLPLYERLRGLGMEQPALVVEPLETPDPGAARETLRAAVKKALTAVAGRASAGSGGSADLLVLEHCLAWLEESSPKNEVDPQAAAGDYARNAAGALEITRKFFPSRRTKALQEDLEEVRAALTVYRRSLAAVSLAPMLGATNDLLGRFHRRYRERKRDGGLLDYSDLELGARALLKSQATDDAPVMGPDSRLMVDEFQDTNRLQCSIVDRLHPGATLIVGDERQSIYRFRGADVDVFVRRQAELLERAGDGVVHRLEVSYRARREVLEFINQLFAGSGFFGSLHRPLICGRAEEGRASPDGPMETERPARKLSPAVEILCAERPQSPLPNEPASTMQHAEAEAVADRVHRAVTHEHWEPREIVILLPALTHVDAYQSALAVRGVPTYVVRGKGYYSREEIFDMRSLLGVLVDPHDDLSLLALLRSPLVGLSDDTLLILAREARRRRADSLWSVVRERRSVEHLADDQAARLREALSALEDLAACPGRPGLARLVDRAMTAFDYDLCLLAGPEGRRRFANIRKLMRLADEFESVEGPDLAGFVRLLDTVGDLSDDEGSAPTLAEDENVVRVMSIHQAKGLEFPVVVLAGLGSNSPGTRTGAFLIGHDGRMAVVLKDSRRDPYEQHDLALGPAEEIEEEEARGEREEDVRLLYVAMTRAQERLFLVGARRSGGLDGCRLGRIALALGLGELPSAGDTWELEGLDALIEGVVAKPSRDDHSQVGRPSPEGYIRRFDETSDEAPEVPDASEIRPVFFEPRGAGAAVRRISYSSLAAYRRCPRRFYLERVLGRDGEAWRGGR